MSTTSIHQRIADYETFLDKALKSDYSSEDKGYSIDTNDTHVEIAFFSPVTTFKLRTHEIPCEDFTPENFTAITLKILNSALSEIEDRVDDAVEMGVDVLDAANNYAEERVLIIDDIRKLEGKTARHDLVTELYPEATLEDIVRTDLTVHVNTRGEDRSWWVRAEAQTPYGLVVCEEHCDLSDLPLEIDAENLELEGHRYGIDPAIYVPATIDESLAEQKQILTASFEAILPELLKDTSQLKAPSLSPEELVARVMEQINPLINIRYRDEISRMIDDAVSMGITMGRNQKIECHPQLQHLVENRFVLEEVYDRDDITEMILRAMISSSYDLNVYDIDLARATTALADHDSLKALVDHMMKDLSTHGWEDLTRWIEDEVDNIRNDESNSPLKGQVSELETLLLSFGLPKS